MSSLIRINWEFLPRCHYWVLFVIGGGRHAILFDIFQSWSGSVIWNGVSRWRLSIKAY